MCLPTVVVQEGFSSLDDVRLSQNWMLDAWAGFFTTCLRFCTKSWLKNLLIGGDFPSKHPISQEF